MNAVTGSCENNMKKLMLASADLDKLAYLKQGLGGAASALHVKEKLLSNKLSTLIEEISRIKPAVLLLDFDLLGLDSSYSVASFRLLCAETKIVVLGSDIPEDVQWELVKAGMRGYCEYDANMATLNQVVEAVGEGELWIPRALTSRLIDDLCNTNSIKGNASKATLSMLSKLTQREYDIAIRVSQGECNKQIAKACNITERTVKAHLTEIFQKMGVSDRLNLALVLASDSSLTAGNNYGGQFNAAYMNTGASRFRPALM